MVAALKISLLAAALSGAALSSQLTPEQMRWYATQLNSVMPQSAPANIPAAPPAEAVLQWKRFQQSANFPFESYAEFLPAQIGRASLRDCVLQSAWTSFVDDTLTKNT